MDPTASHRNRGHKQWVQNKIKQATPPKHPKRQSKKWAWSQENNKKDGRIKERCHGEWNHHGERRKLGTVPVTAKGEYGKIM